MGYGERMNIGIIGCGLIGQKRLKALPKNIKLLAAADTDKKRAKKLCELSNSGTAHNSWEDVVKNKDIDIVIVATTHNVLAPITKACVEAKKHVLVEKPAAVSLKELENLIPFVNASESLVHVGFNHRYHRAFKKIEDLKKSESLGDFMFLRARYGHGGRLGMQKEWRAQPELSGGGELIDQGVHLIDLSRLFMGDICEVVGHAATYFWQMPVEDNGFMILKKRNRKNSPASRQLF